MSSMTSASPHSVVLALNSGSSSLKFGLYRIEPSIPKVLLSGEVESTGSRQGKFWAKDGNGTVLVSELTNFETSGDAVARIGRCRRSRAPCRSPGNYDQTVSSAMDFMAFPASRSCVNSGTIRQIDS
jgi:hypothetical protein